MPFSVFVMTIIILVSFATVIAVIYLGARENVSGHDEHANESRAVSAWTARAEKASQMTQALATAGDSVAAVATSSEDDEKEARRQAALARKAARASRSE